MSANLAALAYLVAGVLFILALRGLSHPTTSRQGNLFGMIGMAIAVPPPSPHIRRPGLAPGDWWSLPSSSAAASAR